MPQIQYKDPESEEIVSIDIDAGMPVITIGRNPGNVIRVNNPSISRQHAKIVWENETCKLVDLDSSNGSYVNGQQIKSQVLQGKDRLRVGEFPLDFVTGQIEEMENDLASMSHEDIDIGDILSSADVDDALSEFASHSDSFASIESSGISNVSSVSVVSDSEASLAPSSGSDMFGGGEFSEQSLAEVSSIEPVIVTDPDLSGELAAPSAEDLILPEFEAVPVEFDTSEFELRITELTTERDELLDLLQSRAGDAGGAAKVQIDRLRSERDRLIEERRNLQRAQRDLRTQLDAFPPIEEMAALTEELTKLRNKDEQHETHVGSLQSEIDAHFQTIELLNIKHNENLIAIESLEGRVAENANLSQTLEDAQQEIQNFDVVKNELEEKISNLLNDGASSAERDENQLTTIERLENELDKKINSIADLENDKQALMERSLELDELREEHKAIQLELQARPIAEEVQTIIADLASARATIENNDQTIDELETERTDLNQRLESATEAQAQFDSRFEKQGAELTEVQQTYLALKKEKEAFARETDYLMGAKRSYDSEIRSAQKQVQELEKNDRRKKKVFDELRSDLEVLIAENTILQSSLDNIQKELEDSPSSAELQASISLSKQRVEEIAGLKLTLSDLEDELENHTKSAKKESDRYESISSKLKESEAELEALRMVVSDESNSSEQNQELSKTIDENSKTIKDLKKNLESVSSKLSKKETEVGKLKDDNKALKKELGSLKKKDGSKEKATQSKIEKLEKQIAETEEALAEVILANDKLEDEAASK